MEVSNREAAKLLELWNGYVCPVKTMLSQGES